MIPPPPRSTLFPYTTLFRSLLQKAYGAFYWSINFGSFFSFLVVPWVKDHHGYGLAFGVPGILMGMATFIFWLGTKHYIRVDRKSTRLNSSHTVISYAVFCLK